MERKFAELAEWISRVEVKPADDYEVPGQDRTGYRVTAVGIDPEAVVAKCEDDAAKISGRTA